MSTRDPDVTFSIGTAIRSDDIRVPALTTRSFVAWLLGTAAAVVVASVVVLTTQPEHRLGVLVGAPLVAAGIGWRSAWIEPGSVQAAHGATGGEPRTSPLALLLGRPGQPPTTAPPTSSA